MSSWTWTPSQRAEKECGWCEGAGIEKFCPSVPDKCKGCEEMPCRECRCQICEERPAVGEVSCDADSCQLVMYKACQVCLCRAERDREPSLCVACHRKEARRERAEERAMDARVDAYVEADQFRRHGRG